MNKHEKCHVDLLEKAVDKDALSKAMAAYLAVWGMGCPNCERRVHNGLLAAEGVLQVEVVLSQSMAVVIYDPEKVSPDDLVEAVAGAGRDSHHNYRAGVMTVMPATEALAE